MNCSMTDCFPEKSIWRWIEHVYQGVKCKALRMVRRTGYRAISEHTSSFYLFCTTLSMPNICFRFFYEIASDCDNIDASNHSLSFISDANVLALHRLLWINQEKIGDYLSSSRYGSLRFVVKSQTFQCLYSLITMTL